MQYKIVASVNNPDSTAVFCCTARLYVQVIVCYSEQYVWYHNSNSYTALILQYHNTKLYDTQYL